MAENQSQADDEAAEQPEDPRVEDQVEGVQFDVDRTSGVVEVDVYVKESRIEELPEDWDVEDFVGARAKQYIEQDLKNIYSLGSVKTMVSEVDGFASPSGDDERHFEVWAKW